MLGRYFAASPYTLAASILCKKTNESGSLHYCMSDGCFGGSLIKKAYLPQYPFQIQTLKVMCTVADAEEVEGEVAGVTSRSAYTLGA